MLSGEAQVTRSREVKTRLSISSRCHPLRESPISLCSDTRTTSAPSIRRKMAQSSQDHGTSQYLFFRWRSATAHIHERTAKVWKNFQLLYDLVGHQQSVWAVLAIDGAQFLTGRLLFRALCTCNLDGRTTERFRGQHHQAVEATQECSHLPGSHAGRTRSSPHYRHRVRIVLER